MLKEVQIALNSIATMAGKGRFKGCMAGRHGWMCLWLWVAGAEGCSSIGPMVAMAW